jgi:hypothetical protein
MITRKTVKFKLDPKNPKLATAAQLKRLAVVAAMPDSAIDYSDIPKQLSNVLWTRPGARIAR